MKILLATTIAALLSAAAPAAPAQPASAPCAAGPAASGPAGNCPRGGAPGPGRMMQRHWGKDYTPGWSLMNESERSAHRDKMLSLRTQEECRSYMKEHQEQMAARAQERGRSLPAQPRRDACARFKPATP